MKRTRKTKLSLGLKIASVLTCIALLSVGFASWLIIHNPEDVETAGGTITAEATEDATVALNVSLSGNIVFGKPSGEINTGWLRPTSSMAAENLIASGTLSATKHNELTGYALTITFTPSDLTEFTEAVTNEYLTVIIKLGDLKTITIDNLNVSTEGALVLTYAATADLSSVPLSVEFKWGDAFGGKNPYTYFNALTGGYESNHADAEAAINGLAELSGVTYKLVVGATVS